MTPRDTVRGRAAIVSVAVLGVWLGCPPPALAHRLDEYLQATLLSIDRDRVGVEIALSPGASVAPQICGSIDTGGDGQIDSTEADAYARKVLSAIGLVVDRQTVRLELEDSRFPTLRDMRFGTGTIRLRATAKTPVVGAGHHQLSYRNAHEPDGSVYLVNALVPADPSIQISAERRDGLQHSLTLDFTVAPDTSTAAAWWLLAGLTMVGVLGITRKRSGRVSMWSENSSFTSSNQHPDPQSEWSIR